MKCDAGLADTKAEEEKNSDAAAKAKKEADEETKKVLGPKKINHADLAEELKVAKEAQEQEKEKEKKYEEEK